MDDPKKMQEEELEELLKAIEELEKHTEDNKKKKPPKKPFIAVEFGGVFHPNRVINFLFGFLVNLTVAFTVIEVFSLATYDEFYYIVLFMLAYSAMEYVLRLYLLINHFKWIIRSFGTIFYFGYIIIFYVLDYYVFTNTIEFDQGILLMVFITMFTIVRYFVALTIRKKLR